MTPIMRTAPGRAREGGLSPELVREMTDELVAHLREEREALRREWVRMMAAKGLLEGLSAEETETESAAIYDTCVGCLDTGDFAPAREHATRMAQRGVLGGMTPEQILGSMMTLRDVYGRSLVGRHLADPDRLADALDVYEPVANGILTITALAFIEERERVMAEQQEMAIRELSTPVLRVRDGILILPIIGMLDSNRARQLTDQLLHAIREERAKAVVIDITGVPAVDSKVANHLIQTVEAARLLGTTAIVTGVSPEIARTVVTIGVDLSAVSTVGDLQGGIDRADRLLGYTVIRQDAVAASLDAG